MELPGLVEWGVLGGIGAAILVPIGVLLSESVIRFVWFNRVRDALGRLPGLDGGAWDGKGYQYSGRVRGVPVRVWLREDRLIATVGPEHFRLPAGLELHVREGASWRAPDDPARRLRTGDPAFDETWLVRPSRPMLAPELAPALRQVLLAHAQPGLLLTEEAASVMCRLPADGPRAERAVDRLVRLVLALDEQAAGRAAG